MAFSENLRRLRKAAGLTQEGLAAGLHVTNQAVSKWECGESYPEVLLLPRLAARLGVTVDALLTGCPDGAAVNETVEAANRLIDQDKEEAALRLLRRGTEENPAIPWLRFQLATLYARIAERRRRAGDEAGYLGFLQDAAREAEQAAQTETDPLTRRSAENLLSRIYYDLGDGERLRWLQAAQAQREPATLLRALHGTASYRGNDRVYAAQQALLELTGGLLDCAEAMAAPYQPGGSLAHPLLPGEEDWETPAAARAERLTAVLSAYDALFPGEGNPLLAGKALSLSLSLCRLWLEAGKFALAGKALEQAADCALKMDARDAEDRRSLAEARYLYQYTRLSLLAPSPSLRQAPDPAGVLASADPETRRLALSPLFDSPLLDRLCFANSPRMQWSADQRNQSAQLLDELDAPIYAPLRANPAFPSLSDRLRAAARRERDPALAACMRETGALYHENTADT